MVLNDCALCGLPITDENDSKEHIIPNSIGGRKKVAGFICKKCNSASGQEWDSDLARQLNSLSLFFGISRQRGDVPSQIIETTEGERLRLNADGSMGLAKPLYSETPNGSNVEVSINARTDKEAKEMLDGLKRKYPQVDLEAFINDIKWTSYYPKGMVKFEMYIGGEKAGRSIVKTCLAQAVDSGIDPKLCKAARDYLIKSDSEACFGYYYERDLVMNRPKNAIFHCVSISGNPDTKLLLGYVEYYGVWRILACLSDEYDGAGFSRTYALNPISGENINIEVNINIEKDEIPAAYRYEKIPEGSIEKALREVIPLGMERSYKKEQERVLNEAVEYAFNHCGAEEGGILTEEQKNKLFPLIWEKLELFIVHHLKKHKNESRDNVQ